MTFQEFMQFILITIGEYKLTIAMLLLGILALVGSRVIYHLINRIIQRRFKRKHRQDEGRLFAFAQITKYVVYTIGVLMALQAFGIQLSVLWAGAAALLVGFGLGMQQTFNDLVSGIILLLEGTVDVGDVVIVDGMPGKVKEIGIRTSKVMTQNQDYILVPNSKLVVDHVHNLSYNEGPTRFQVSVGVAYGSDVELVSELLLKSAQAHPDVVDDPMSQVFFKNFGDSSLDFVLHFYSYHFMAIPRIQSEIRFNINQLFAEAGVEIPFPQRDVHIRKD